MSSTEELEKQKTDAIINAEKHLKRISGNLTFFFWMFILGLLFYLFMSIYGAIVP